MSGPIEPPDRVEALGVLRGVALFGVLTVNLVTIFRQSLFEEFLHGPEDAWARAVSFGLEFKAVTLFSLLFVLVLGALSFAAMGLGITGLVRSAEGSSAVVNAVYLPMAIISGTFFSPKGYPSFLKAIAEVTPLTHYTQLTRDVMLRNEHFWNDMGAVGVVALWGAIGVVGAVRGFRWQPRDSS